MRIAHVVSTFPPYCGGQGNVAREIAERTAESGHEVVVVTPRRIRNQEIPISNFQILYSRVRFQYGNAAWCPSIAHVLEYFHPDIVHLHWPFIGGIAPALAWRRGDTQCRLVVQYHMDLLADGWRGAAFAAYQQRALPCVLAAADRVVVSSLDYARHGALAPFIAGLGDRLIEIPIGVDVERFTQNAERRTQNARPFDVLFVGGLDRAHAFKGVDVLLRAIAQTPDVRLRIVGDGDLRLAHEARARALRISDRVEFLGSVSDAGLPSIYHSADVFVLPSTSRSEAFGVVLLEAMASGLPLIASDLPGVRTVVANGGTGFLVPPDDAQSLAERLAVLARDPDRAARMGAAGRRRAEATYAWDGIIERWLQCYRTVCADG